MSSFITKAALAPAALSAALLLSVSLPASAQAPVTATGAPIGGPSTITNGMTGDQPNTLTAKNKGLRTTRSPVAMRRPLTVRRAGAPVVAAAPAAAAPGAVNPVTGALGIGSTVVGLPFQVLGGIFPADINARKGGVTDVPYENQRPKVAEIDEGWTTAVPVNRSGPTYVVANGDPTISPLVLIGLPLRAVGTVAQTPFRVLSSPFGGLPGGGTLPGF